MIQQIIKSSAIALMMAICIACTPPGEYIVFGKEIRGKYNDSHVLILKHTHSGELYSAYVGINRYYNVEIGDTITIQ